MSLKSCLQLLLDTYHSSHKSVPFIENYQMTTLTHIRNGNGIQSLGSYIAPSDGFLVCQIEIPTTDKATEFIQIDGNDVVQTCCYDWGWPVVSVPIAKGKKAYIKLVATLTDGTEIKTYVRFYPYKGSV